MTITIDRRAAHVVLTLDQPAKLNALSGVMIGQLSNAFHDIESDSELRCVILTGIGDKAFCAGTDIAELTQLNEDEARKVSERGQALCNQIENCPLPVIGAINGIAAGGGCELALACHIRIASDTASFSLPESKLGVIPAYGGTQRLAREIGNSRALDLMLTGKTIGAAEAVQIGLINRLASSRDLIVEAESLAEEIARLAPLAIRACLKAVTLGVELPLAEGLALEAELFAALFATEDMREGTSAFLEKRPPVFKGT